VKLLEIDMVVIRALSWLGHITNPLEDIAQLKAILRFILGFREISILLIHEDVVPNLYGKDFSVTRLRIESA